MNNNTMLEAALAYARKGIYVFPCIPRDKRPATTNSFKDASKDEDQVRRWWTENPNYNIGIPTGERNGFWVLDIDGDEGYESYAKFRGEIDRHTPQVKTGSGGLHLYFTYSEELHLNNGVKVLPGLDIRADGGYVIAPPSIHESGDAYEWQGGSREPTEAPESLVRALKTRPRGSTVDFSRPIPESSRNATLTRMAGQLTRIGMDDGSVRATLHFINKSQCKPPLENSEVDGISLYENQASPSPSLKGSGSDDTLQGVKMFKNIDRPTGERPFIVKGVVHKGHGGGLYGDGGTAKSMLAMDMGQCVARGGSWIGFETTRTNVLYLDFELDEIEQTRRAYDVAAGHGYDAPPNGFFYLSGAGHPTKEVFGHALDACRLESIGMVILDSLGYALEGDAEASRDVLRFFKDTEASFRREGITLFVVDHQAKTQQGGRYQEKTMFGSVYKSNSLRSVLQVEPSNHEDGYLSVVIRQKKNNFGRLLDPFGAEITFGENETRISGREIEAGELLVQREPTVKDKIRATLEENGGMFPDAISEATGVPLATVKNNLTEMRKNEEVEDTGDRDGNAREVRLKTSQPALVA